LQEFAQEHEFGLGVIDDQDFGDGHIRRFLA
jgi:hypothetical protein